MSDDTKRKATSSTEMIDQFVACWADCQIERDSIRRDLQAIIDAACAEMRGRCAKASAKAINAIRTGTQEARDWTLADLRGMCINQSVDAIRALKE